MLKGKSGERCTWYIAGNLHGLDRREDADLALSVMQLIQEGNVRTKRDKTYHVVISLHPNDRKLADREFADIVRRTVAAVGLQEHQYIAVRHSDQDHEHVHIAVNKIHPVTLKVHHPFRDIPLFKVLADELEKELGLYQVDRSVRRIDSDRSPDYESAREVQSFSRWARGRIGERIDLDGVSNWNELHARLAVNAGPNRSILVRRDRAKRDRSHQQLDVDDIAVRRAIELDEWPAAVVEVQHKQ